MVSKANNRLATVVSFIALFVALMGNTATLFFAEKASATSCNYAYENREKIREQISAGDPNLLKPGDAGYVYYKEHPDEKASLVKAIDKSLARFPSIDCS